jgi:Ankyrin repeat
VKSLQGKDEGMTETISRVCDKYGNGVLHWAAAQGRTEICHYLIEELGFPVNSVDFKHGQIPHPSKKKNTGSHYNYVIITIIVIIVTYMRVMYV